jgi:hypothetical protein
MGKVPSNWRELHDCSRFKDLDEQGRCFFCQRNAELAKDGCECIPFDVPGVYDASQEPNIIVREVPKAADSEDPN